MRRLVFLSSGALALVVGCGLVGTYDYDAYEGVPVESSSSSSGNGGMGGVGGMGGLGGMGGMMPECPPDGGMITPDLCDNGVDEDCSGGDCSVKANWSGRFGDPLHQQVQALTTSADGGLALIGKFTGTMNIGAIPLTAPDNSKIYSYVTRLDANRAATFSKYLDAPADIQSIALQGDTTYITGKFPPQIPANGNVFVRRLNKTGSYAVQDGGWELDWAQNADISTTRSGTSNFEGAPVFVTGNVKGISAFPLGCAIPPNAPPLAANKNYAFLISVAPQDKDCTWGAAIENASPFSISVNNNIVVVGFYSAPLIGLPNPLPPGGNLSSFAVAYHPATHKVLWERYLTPTGSTESVSLLSVTLDENDNAFATGTFQGTLVINGKSYTSEAGGTKYDLFVIAFDTANKGNVLWFDHFGGPDIGMPPAGITQVPNSIVATRDGVYLSGRTPPNMAIEPGRPSGPICKSPSCAFLLKLDPTTGKTIWAREFGEGEMSTDGGFRLAASADSLWLGGGWEKDVDLGTPLSTKGAQDAILARFYPLP